MTPTHTDARKLAADRLRARRERVALVRRRVLALAGSSFALGWGVIFVQLVSGHDPALAHSNGRATNTGASTATSAGATAASSAGGSNSSNSSTSSGSSGSTSPVTTSQS